MAPVGRGLVPCRLPPATAPRRSRALPALLPSVQEPWQTRDDGPAIAGARRPRRDAASAPLLSPRTLAGRHGAVLPQTPHGRSPPFSPGPARPGRSLVRAQVRFSITGTGSILSAGS